jgi:hypothetical protein
LLGFLPVLAAQASQGLKWESSHSLDGLKSSNGKLVMAVPLSLLVVPALLLLAPLASASSNVPSNGTPAIGFLNNGSITITGTTVGNGYTIYAYTSTHTLNGTDTGTVVGTGAETLYADGYWTSHGTATFTGTIDGIQGTAIYTYQAQGVGNNAEGSFVFGHGTGGLVGVHEEGTTSFGGPGLTYTGSYWGNFVFTK